MADSGTNRRLRCKNGRKIAENETTTAPPPEKFRVGAFFVPLLAAMRDADVVSVVGVKRGSIVP